MRIISRFVREQRRYTKNELRTTFAFDEEGVERFIKNLKSYGILKTVGKNNDQKELSDLVDEDLIIVEETAGNDDCYYVFSYVGIITIGPRVIKVYPKYLKTPKDDDSRGDQMKLVLKVLERYSRSTDQIINLFNGDGDNRSFNILAVILFLISDYHENGIYSNSEDIIEVNGEGSILWTKTIDDSFALIEDERPYYMELYTAKTIDDEQDYFKRLHECVLTECSRQLKDAQLDSLFDLELAELSDEPITNFGDKDYILNRLHGELNVQFNTRRQILLKTIYTYIAQDKKMLVDDQGISMYGTTAFHVVWEKACAQVFNNKLDTVIGKLPLTNPLSDKYKGKKRTKLIDIIEKPEWKGTDMDEPKYATKTLIPDLITIDKHNNRDYFVILDAKYYNIQLTVESELRGNPGIEDLTKQYLYQLAYRDFLQENCITEVRNCFLMPTEENEIVIKGTAKLPMLESLGLENIQIRQIPAERLYNCYLSRRTIDLDDLALWNE